MSRFLISFFVYFYMQNQKSQPISLFGIVSDEHRTAYFKLHVF